MPVFEFPDDLLAAQRGFFAARDDLAALHARLPKFTDPQPEQLADDGTVLVPASPGWTAEDWAERNGAMERMRQCAATVHAHPFWDGVKQGDLVEARSALQQAALPEDQRHTPGPKGR